MSSKNIELSFFDDNIKLIIYNTNISKIEFDKNLESELSEKYKKYEFNKFLFIDKTRSNYDLSYYYFGDKSNNKLIVYPIIEYTTYFKQIDKIPENKHLFLIYGKVNNLSFLISNDVSKYLFFYKNKFLDNKNKSKLSELNVDYKDLDKLVGAIYLFEKKESKYEFIKVEDYFYDFLSYLISKQEKGKKQNIKKALKGFGIEHFILQEGIYKEEGKGKVNSRDKIESYINKYWGALLNKLSISIKEKNDSLSFNLTGYTNSSISFSYVNSLGDLLDILIYFYNSIIKVRKIEKDENIKIPMFLADKSFSVLAEKELIVDDIINNHNSVLQILHIFPRFSIEKDGDIYSLEERESEYRERNKNTANLFLREFNKYKKRLIYKSNNNNVFEIKKENMLILFKKKESNYVYLARVLGKTLSRGNEVKNKVKIYKIDYPLKTSLKKLFNMQAKIFKREPTNCKEKYIHLKRKRTKKDKSGNKIIEIEEKWLCIDILDDGSEKILTGMNYYFCGKSNKETNEKNEDKISKYIVKLLNKRFNKKDKNFEINSSSKELADIIGYKIKNNTLYLHLIHTKLAPFLNKAGEKDSAYSAYEAVEAQVINRLTMLIENDINYLIEKVNSFFNNEKLINLDNKTKSIQQAKIIISIFINKNSITKGNSNKKYYISNIETLNFIGKIIFGKLSRFNNSIDISFSPIIIETL